MMLLALGSSIFGQGVIQIPDPPVLKSPYLASKVVDVVRNRYSDFIALQSHRGHWETWPENTKWAYYDAMKKGVELLEIDLRSCDGYDEDGDECIVVQHDSNLGRVTTATNGTRTLDVNMTSYKNLWMKDRAGRVMPIRPLTFRELLQFVHSTQENGKSVVLIVDCKRDETVSAYENFKRALKVVNRYSHQTNYTFNREALVWKLWLANAPTEPSTLEFDTGWSASSVTTGQNIVLTVWPPNYSPQTAPVDGSKCGISNPQPCEVQYNKYKNKPYLAHFELITSYLGDPLATWVQELQTNNKAMGDYWHDDVLPEGISGSNGACCLFSLTRSEVYKTSPYTPLAGEAQHPTGFGNLNMGCWAYTPAGNARGICQDQRGFLDLVLGRNPTSIVSDKAADLIPFLEVIGKRASNRLQ